MQDCPHERGVEGEIVGASMTADDVDRPNFWAENRPLILLRNFARSLVFFACGLPTLTPENTTLAPFRPAEWCSQYLASDLRRGDILAMQPGT